MIAITIIAVTAPMLAPYDPNKSSVFFLQPPSAQHWLGTDELGRDILSRLIFGARTSLVIGIGAAVVAVLIGAPIGLSAGYFRGRVDLMIVPVIDLFVALPALILALIITVMVGPSLQEPHPRSGLRHVADDGQAGQRANPRGPGSDVHRGCRRRRGRVGVDHPQARVAQHHARRGGAVCHRCFTRHHHGRESELSGPWYSSTDGGLGWHGAIRF